MESGRLPISKHDQRPDGSRWREPLIWTEAAECGPVFGHAILVQSHDGTVHVLDLRAADDYEFSHDKEQNEREWEWTKAALKQADAKWWAYLPLGPPTNVAAVPWNWDGDKPVPATCDDPPREDWVVLHHQQHRVIDARRSNDE